MELVLTGFGELEGIELLQKIPLFSRLTYDETSRLAPIIQHVDVGGGAVVIEQNALGDALYVIQDGEVRVSREVEGDAGHDEKLPKSDFERLLQADAALAVKVYRSFCRTLSDRLRRANQMLSAKTAHSVAVR